jgi:hypothetical protein
MLPTRSDGVPDPAAGWGGGHAWRRRRPLTGAHHAT